MSRRTSEASKAITAAWAKEKLLVDDGKGTRDWTPDQQTDIQNKGKAYDENGKAYQGHHMKSAEAYPEYQGDADNIQFLMASEHSAAHNNGNYSIPTNGCYAPITGITKDFGSNIYEPCKAIELSNPVTIKHGNQINENDFVQKIELTTSGNSTKSQQGSDKLPRKNRGSIKAAPKSIPERIKRFIVAKAAGFGIETKADVWRIIKMKSLEAVPVVIPIVVTAVAEAVVETAFRTRTNGQKENNLGSYDYSNDNYAEHDDDYQTYDDIHDENVQPSTNQSERSSPIEHTVRPHPIKPYTRKDGTPVSGSLRGGEDGYPRGGNKTED